MDMILAEVTPRTPPPSNDAAVIDLQSASLGGHDCHRENLDDERELHERREDMLGLSESELKQDEDTETCHSKFSRLNEVTCVEMIYSQDQPS